LGRSIRRQFRSSRPQTEKHNVWMGAP